MKNKDQHLVPNSYLKAWCDPRTPLGHEPYIWRISKDGAQKKKRAPENSFKANNRYTIRFPNGERNLVVENSLGQIENYFVSVRKRIMQREQLTILDKMRLCSFTAAMYTRAASMGDQWKELHKGIHNQVIALEKKRGAKPAKSLETFDMMQHAHPYLVEASLEVLAPMLFRMPMSILIADDELGFVTSDNPCLWNVPNAHRLPPMLRTPSLSQPEIEISLPLTPQHLLLITHRRYSFYVDVTQETVDSANRLRCLDCSQEFVSWKGEIRPGWLDPGTEPDDAWEKTAEGKAALAEAEQSRKWQAEYETRRRKLNRQF